MLLKIFLLKSQSLSVFDVVHSDQRHTLPKYPPPALDSETGKGVDIVAVNIIAAMIGAATGSGGEAVGAMAGAGTGAF